MSQDQGTAGQDQDLSDQDQDTADQGTLSVPVNQYLREGMVVYDMRGKRVGHVRRYALAAGYMLVEGGSLHRQDYYVPLKVVQTIDPREIYLSIAQDQLARDYTAPPRAEEIPVWQERPGGDSSDTVVWHELPSGYGGGPIAVDPVDLDAVVRQLVVGMTVMDVTDNFVGQIVRLDPSRSVMVVEDIDAGPRELLVPYDAVARVNSDDGVVTLLVPRESIVAEGVAPPPAADASA